MTFRTEFEHRDDLLRAALAEFCERGYDGSSINRILADSGVSKGQLYHHFDGKQGLYLALVEWMIDRKVEWMLTVDTPSSDDFFTALGTQMAASVTFAHAHPDVDRLTTALLAERGRPIFRAVTERFGFDPEGALGSLVAVHHSLGRFRPELSLAFVQREVLLSVNHLPELLDLGDAAHLVPKIDELIGFLRRGLAGT